MYFLNHDEARENAARRNAAALQAKVAHLSGRAGELATHLLGASSWIMHEADGPGGQAAQLAMAFAARSLAVENLDGAMLQAAQYFSGEEGFSPRMEGNHGAELLRLLHRENAPLHSYFCEGSEEQAALQGLLGAEQAALCKRMWDKTALFARFSVGRWCVRPASDAQCVPQALFHLTCYMALLLDDFSVEGWLQNLENSNKARRFAVPLAVTRCIAALLDEDGPQAQALLQRLEAIVHDHSGQSRVSRELLYSLLRSENTAAHDLACRLLSTAQLEEGLRQTLLSTADRCPLKAFRRVLCVLRDEQLSRFPSVVHAFSQWTRLGDLDTTRTTALLEVACGCLTDAAFRQACLHGETVEPAFVALWTLALENADQAEEAARLVLREGSGVQRRAALLSIPFFSTLLARHHLVRPLFDAALTDSLWQDEALLHHLIKLAASVPYAVRDDAHSVCEAGGEVVLPCAEARSLYSSLTRLLERGVPVPREDVQALQLLLLKRRFTSTPEAQQREKDFAKTFSAFKERWALRFELSMYGFSDVPHSDGLDELCMEVDGQPCSLRDAFSLEYATMTPDMRRSLLWKGIHRGLSPVQRRVLLALLTDRDTWTMDTAWNAAFSSPFSEDELLVLENYLRLKNPRLRVFIYAKLLLELETQPQKLQACLARLHGSKDALRRKAGEELLDMVRRRKDVPEFANMTVEVGSEAPTPVRMSAPQAPRMADLYSAANGFGLYDPAAPPLPLPLPSVPQRLDAAAFFGVEDVCHKAQRFVERICAVLEEHKGMEYVCAGSFGDESRYALSDGCFYPLRRVKGVKDEDLGLEQYPLAEHWQRILDEEAPSLRLLLYLDSIYSFTLYAEKSWVQRLPGSEGFLALQAEVQAKSWKGQSAWGYAYTKLRGIMLNRYTLAEKYAAMRDYVLWVMGALPEVPQEELSEYLCAVGRMDEWLGYHVEDSCFVDVFHLRYLGLLMLRQCGVTQRYRSFTFDFVLRAYAEGLLTDAEFTRIVVEGELGGCHCFGHDGFTDPRQQANIIKRAPALPAVVDRVAQRVVDMEKERGEAPTPLSALACSTLRCTGARHVVDLLAVLGDEPYDRSFWDMGVSDTASRTTMLSHLLYRSVPAPGEDAGTLSTLLQGRAVSEQQLLDGALFAPQWVELVAQHLGWAGLESACWYFQAHICESFSAAKEAVVARYSPIDPKDFNEGAFDSQWFNEAHAALGEKRFQMLYKAAKYVSGGANHKRAQLFADAQRGKLGVAEAEKRLVEKRTITHVLCYGIIPLSKDAPMQDALHRYDVLQEFRRGSKQFGAARQTSENRAVDIAIDNMARNAGYADATRFIWGMEGEKYRSLEGSFSPRRVGDVDVWLEVDEQGQAELRVRKGDKAQKSLPAPVRKDPQVQDILNAQKLLGEQRSRARATLERAMERAWSFTAEEVRTLSANPLLGPLVRHLLFMPQDNPGLFAFPADLPLKSSKACFVLAHPLHLYRAGLWSQWQSRLFDLGIVQPFKQVFRELYVPVAGEVADNATTSHRYEDCPLRPRRGLALLKGRGWKASGFEGLEKVFYEEDLVAHVFSPGNWLDYEGYADEDPTVEEIFFRTRRGDKAVPLKDVPEVIFSEVMRDMDLLVSVAHAGDEPWEGSASTLEMRQAVVREAVRLFRLTHVTVEGSKAVISGTRGNYTVHLGSGVVHKAGRGALTITAVPARRGGLFLPFADEDSGTANVLTKVLCFAEDGTIKDPSILEQLL